MGPYNNEEAKYIVSRLPLLRRQHTARPLLFNPRKHTCKPYSHSRPRPSE